jgi:hypothetical protein
MVTNLEDNPTLNRPRYALTTFNGAVETHVILGDDISIVGNDFKNVVSDLTHGGGLTCTSGGLRAVFRANFGAVNSFGRVNAANTNLRRGVLTVIYLISDKTPTSSLDPLSSNPSLNCNALEGNCQCTTGFGEILIDSTDIYDEIKKANSRDFPNTVVSIGVGAGVNPTYLDTVSDNYLDILTGGGGLTVSEMAEEVTTKLLCGDGTPRPSFAPTVSGPQPCTDGTDCGPFVEGVTRGETCLFEFGTDICIEGFCTENACENPLELCKESCVISG